MILEFIISTKYLILVFGIIFVVLFHLLFDVMADLMYYYYLRDSMYVGKTIAVVDVYKTAKLFKPIIKSTIAIPYSKSALIVEANFYNLTKRSVSFK